MRTMLWALVLLPILYVSSCGFLSARKNSIFSSVNVGDTQKMVIDKMGEPNVRELPGVLYSRYASLGCQPPCAVRLWYENRLSLDTEAWSFEVNDAGGIINKTRWRSP
jgi:hypothetical protein